ncbi:hypothetical protein [Streptomyces sodiiphilus]|uniref:hypothetical protein n=1 Tax=Streptomyces sodiiphilus TaxID=226217 RepID=UPI0031D1A95C
MPDAEDKSALREWLAARRSELAEKPPPRTLSELRALQLKRLARSLQEDAPEQADEVPSPPVLRFALDGGGVRANRVESALLGEWLQALQATVQSVAYALDELRLTRDAGPVPKSVQSVTKLFSGPLFASSYGMVLEGGPVPELVEMPGTGTDRLLDRAVNRIFDVADRASSASDAEEAVLDAALPLGRRAISHLSELAGVLASAGANVTLNWESSTTIRRTTFTSASAERCRSVLRSAHVDEGEDRLAGTLVGGSKVRGVIEIEIPDGRVELVRAPKEEVTALLASHAKRHVVADVHVSTARSAGGREHRSYALIGLRAQGGTEPPPRPSSPDERPRR